MTHRSRSHHGWLIAWLLAVPTVFTGWAAGQVPADQVKDLSLLVSPQLPCVWPVGMTPFAMVTARTFGLHGTHRDWLVIDEHTGTQWDAPAHFVPPPDSGLPGAGPNGLITGEKVPAWQFCGEACVIDVTAYRDQAPDGSSFLIRPEHVQAWEKAHRPLRFGDVVLFRSDYTDRYYQAFPVGNRFVADALRKDAPGWPAPTPETMHYLAEKGVMTLGLDSASMGPLPDLAVATHQAGGQHGMIWTECATNLGALPTTGAFFALLAAKHAGGSGGECRCIAITEPSLAQKLIEKSRQKQVVDLSVTLHEDFPITWAGYEPGDEATRYVAKTLNAFAKARGPYFARTHILDTQVGTHVTLPSYSLPPPAFDRATFAPDVQQFVKKYEGQFGALPASTLTIDQAPLNTTLGAAYVIDVRKLVGSTKPEQWPASPEITLAMVQAADAQRPIRAGDVVLFCSGYSDAHFQPLPESPAVDRLFAEALQGKAEGWPSPSLEVIDFLAKKGVRCVGTDGPTLAGVNREQAQLVTWRAAAHGMFLVEFLTNLGAIAGHGDAYFMFAPIKIAGTRGGYGRAIALW